MMSFVANIKILKLMRICVLYSTSTVEHKPRDSEIESVKINKLKPFSKEMLLSRFNLDLLEYPEVENNEGVAMTRTASSNIESLMKNHEMLDRAVLVKQLSATGIMGISIPSAIKENRYNWMMVARLVESLIVDVDYTLNYYLPQVLVCQTVLSGGNDDQKEKFVGPLVSGQLQGCLAMTEGWSDMMNVESIRATATVGEDSQSWIINGTKSQVFNYAESDVVIVWAKTDNGDIAPFIVASKTEGISPVNSPPTANRSCIDLRFTNVVVPKEGILSSQLGIQLPRFISSINNSCTAAACSALIKGLINIVNEFTCGRHIFGKPLSQFETTQAHLVALTADSYAAESLAYLTAGLLDIHHGNDFFIESVLAKVYCVEALRRCVDLCVKITGANCLSDPKFKKVYEDASTFLRNQALPTQSRLNSSRECMEYVVEQVSTSRFSLYEKVCETIGGYRIKGYLRGDLIVNSLKYNLHQRVGALADRVYVDYEQITKLLKTRCSTHDLLNDDFCLHRLSQVLIDSLVMMAVLGRASRSICIGIRNHDHEVRLAEEICARVCGGITTGLGLLRAYPGNVEECGVLVRALRQEGSTFTVKKELP